MKQKIRRKKVSDQHEMGDLCARTVNHMKNERNMESQQSLSELKTFTKTMSGNFKNHCYLNKETPSTGDLPFDEDSDDDHDSVTDEYQTLSETDSEDKESYLTHSKPSSHRRKAGLRKRRRDIDQYIKSAIMMPGVRLVAPSHAHEGKPEVMLGSFPRFMQDEVEESIVLLEIKDKVQRLTYSSGASLYAVDKVKNVIRVWPDLGKTDKREWDIELGTSVAAHVAVTGQSVVVEDMLEDIRFPDGIAWISDKPLGEGEEPQYEGQNDGLHPKVVLAVPVVADDDGIIAVIELFRVQDRGLYARRDILVVTCLITWLGSAIFLSRRRRTLQKRQEVRDRLLNMVQKMVAEELTFAEVLCSMLILLKDALNVSYGVLYITDRQDSGLADLWQECLTNTEQENIILIKRNQKVVLRDEQPMIDEVIQSNQPVIINDVVSARQFHSERERMRGTTVKDVLLLPITGRDNEDSAAVAAIALVNKNDERKFSKNDIHWFEDCGFTHFFAMAIFMGHVSTTCEYLGHEHEVQTELLKHHIQPCSHDLKALSDAGSPDAPPKGFYFYQWVFRPEEEITIPQLVLFMMTDLFGKGDPVVWSEFVLTVRNVYRNVPYHNFTHAFYVLHCTYLIIKENQTTLTEFEMKLLFVAALCVDLDHSGVNDNYLIHTRDCLAKVYPVSPHENHHADMAMLILEIFNIFPAIKSDAEKYETFKTQIRKLIIATDLENYFTNRRRLLRLLRENSYQWSKLEHRQLLLELVLVTADLCVSCKPHPECTRNALCRKEEFLRQGDKELECNIKPLCVMDRTKGGLTPTDELSLCEAICSPSAELISLLLPPERTLLDMCCTAADYWRNIASNGDEWDLTDVGDWLKQDPSALPPNINLSP